MLSRHGVEEDCLSPPTCLCGGTGTKTPPAPGLPHREVQPGRLKYRQRVDGDNDADARERQGERPPEEMEKRGMVSALHKTKGTRIPPVSVPGHWAIGPTSPEKRRRPNSKACKLLDMIPENR
jgi:hypothetical protein